MPAALSKPTIPEIVDLAKPLTKKFEGIKLVSYLCPAGALTIGYGHTGKDVVPGLCITQSQAERLLEADLAAAARVVLAKVSVPLTAPQAAALTDFVFNLGAGAFASSTLLRKLNLGDYASVPAELRKWTKARQGGRLVSLRGLELRREANISLWNS